MFFFSNKKTVSGPVPYPKYTKQRTLGYREPVTLCPLTAQQKTQMPRLRLKGQHRLNYLIIRTTIILAFTLSHLVDNSL